MKRLLLILCLFVNSLYANTVHFCYFIPYDKTNVAEGALRAAALHLQAWYENQLGDNLTFTLPDSVVEVYYTPHSSDWYSSNDSGDPYSEWFWANCFSDAFLLSPAGLHRPEDGWIFYFDAQPLDGQHAGATYGFCLLGAKDIASIMGVDPDWSQCRGIGGTGHEAGHIFGLAHPDGQPPEIWELDLMGVGYLNYPDCALLESDKAILRSSSFFQRQRHFQPPRHLCEFR